MHCLSRAGWGKLTWLVCFGNSFLCEVFCFVLLHKQLPIGYLSKGMLPRRHEPHRTRMSMRYDELCYPGYLKINSIYGIPISILG
ncbi:hypothetical protein F4818DRAFT_256618 [Hypoxylon cercidicola]|nr:hypothetical protein F4818DRAFT_256618 [Hypoxylon cercidicola]